MNFEDALRASFTSAVGSVESDAVLTSPGVAGLAVMLAGVADDLQIQAVFDEQQWSSDRSFSYSELIDLVRFLNGSGGGGAQPQEWS